MRSGMEGVVWPASELHDEQLQLASWLWNQFSKSATFNPIALLLHIDACLEHQNSAVASKPVTLTHTHTHTHDCYNPHAHANKGVLQH